MLISKKEEKNISLYSCKVTKPFIKLFISTIIETWPSLDFLNNLEFGQTFSISFIYADK